MPEQHAARRFRPRAVATGLVLLGLGVSVGGPVPGVVTTPVRVLGEKIVRRLTGRAQPAKAKEAPKEEKKAFAVTGTVTDLAPGVPRPLDLTLSNPNNFTIQVTALTVTVGAPTGSPACSPSYLTVGSFAGPVLVPANGSAPTTLTVTMSPDAPDDCQLRQFPLTYGGTAVKP